MSLIIAYLGVSKVTVALERYMNAKQTIGCAVLSLRELNQLAMTLTENDKSDQARAWRKQVKVRIIAQVEITIRVIQDTNHANYLAMARVPETGITTEMLQDPMFLMLRLRSLLITSSKEKKNLPNLELHILERMKMMDFLLQYSIAYRELLKIVSTPFPMALTQMGRTFIFLWTLSIPFILSGGRVNRGSAITFVILLTYGFLGLEFVAMKMSNPYGDDGLNDLNVPSIAKATIIGIENDWRASESNMEDDISIMLKDVSSRALQLYENNTLRKDQLQSSSFGNKGPPIPSNPNNSTQRRDPLQSASFGSSRPPIPSNPSNSISKKDSKLTRTNIMHTNSLFSPTPEDDDSEVVANEIPSPYLDSHKFLCLDKW